MDMDDLLRRDRIWFANRSNPSGEWKLYSLTDFKGIRKDTDIRKAYLTGRFYGIPIVGTHDVS